MSNEALADELLAIESIYPAHVARAAGSESTVQVTIPGTDISFHLAFDHAYPETSPRVSGAAGIEKPFLQSVIDELRGAEVLFALLSAVHEREESFVSDPVPRAAGDEEARSVLPQAPEVSWSVGEAIHDRRSVMLGRACRVVSTDEVGAALETVEAKRATHPRIWASRHRDRITGQIVQAYDDDGESAAGGRLAFLLDVTKAEDVLVVVSRWYGGINLGADRFKHISNAARDALDKGGFLPAIAKDTKKTRG